MTVVLGISGHFHDAAAALVVDGQLIAAMQEERFSRVKNDANLPFASARACLSLAGLKAGDIDAVVFYENPYAKLERIVLSSLRRFPQALRQFPRAMAVQLGTKLWVLDALAKGLGVPRRRVIHTEHHRAHAASAYLPSGGDRAAVLTVDGVGEAISAAVWLGEGTTLTCLQHIDYPHSLGLLYSAMTAYLGFEVNEGEYKVMGLAAFGQPVFQTEFNQLITLEPDGRFSLGLEYFGAHTDLEVGFQPSSKRCWGPDAPSVSLGSSKRRATVGTRTSPRRSSTS